ncbi:hypothetical protein QBC39DRAFT_51340 [Podospora conica]|nr:hypothetical protein QBC39DRAFT_51340 [Schizothecium conicum]
MGRPLPAPLEQGRGRETSTGCDAVMTVLNLDLIDKKTSDQNRTTITTPARPTGINTDSTGRQMPTAAHPSCRPASEVCWTTSWGVVPNLAQSETRPEAGHLGPAAGLSLDAACSCCPPSLLPPSRRVWVCGLDATGPRAQAPSPSPSPFLLNKYTSGLVPQPLSRVSLLSVPSHPSGNLRLSFGLGIPQNIFSRLTACQTRLEDPEDLFCPTPQPSLPKPTGSALPSAVIVLEAVD